MSNVFLIFIWAIIIRHDFNTNIISWLLCISQQMLITNHTPISGGYPNIALYICSVLSDNCIHRIASGGYYGFDFVTPTPPPPQCVERFHRYRSNEKNFIASLLKFAGYIHSHKILPGNIFGLILKNKMAATSVFRL